MEKDIIQPKKTIFLQGKAVRWEYGDTGLHLDFYSDDFSWYIHFRPFNSLETPKLIIERARRFNLLCRGLYSLWSYSQSDKGAKDYEFAKVTSLQQTTLDNATAFSNLFTRRSIYNVVTFREIRSETEIQRQAAMTFNISRFIQLPSNENLILYLSEVNRKRRI